MKREEKERQGEEEREREEDRGERERESLKRVDRGKFICFCFIINFNYSMASQLSIKQKFCVPKPYMSVMLGDFNLDQICIEIN